MNGSSVKTGVSAFIERLRYGVTAARDSRQISVNSFQRLFFFLAPEALVERVVPYGRFRFGGYQFYSRRRDWGVVSQVLLHDEYDILEGLLRENSRPTIADLGASIGLFSLRVFSLRPAAVIHAVEPSPGSFHLLTRNRIENPGLAWHLHQAAIWREDGRVTFRSDPNASPQSAIAADGNAVVPAMRVHTLLTRYIRTRVDLVKMDIEGGEEAAVCDDQSWLSQIGDLLIQIHPGRCDHLRVTDVLRQHFTHVYHIPGRASPNPLYGALRGQCLRGSNHTPS